ncbi:uncharacterized protein SPPG_03728 [Spizellomyces punctatus DAOM BR117]|uniref:F-box domain-containing protein n=1 Tax=Spizellomyces punctatus (strain DAOM BR117) TaxID=645134 RepID=A0A0L0HGM2_SPIPD|nr:uncharacterized protein SPPG_03728 [Spizellomyces punctatus DAOM BR117]KND00601.1 hypothetical protein SPPG_03728 [Spizellomyces punctatus DAOM BR117]|eukprot:XP_016608640.1 hypothetical protein SPPG_03728 [Spizellomyces punctatus DAOM BR117]
MVDLSPDLWLHILSYLPLKALPRLLVLSKSFSELFHPSLFYALKRSGSHIKIVSSDTTLLLRPFAFSIADNVISFIPARQYRLHSPIKVVLEGWETDGEEKETGGDDRVLALEMFHVAYREELERIYYLEGEECVGEVDMVVLYDRDEEGVVVREVRVTPGWIYMGLGGRKTQVQRSIHPNRMKALVEVAHQKGLTSFNVRAEPVLRYLVSGMSLSKAVSTLVEGNGLWDRRSKLEQACKGRGIDASILWKYGLAKRFMAKKTRLDEGELEETIRKMVAVEKSFNVMFSREADGEVERKESRSRWWWPFRAGPPTFGGGSS